MNGKLVSAPRHAEVEHEQTSENKTLQQLMAGRNVLDLQVFQKVVTFKNAHEVRETVAATPLDNLMVETDSPFLAPMPYRGKRCEPAYTRHTAERVAEVKGVSLAELSEVTCATAHNFFPKLS